jgi:hypothetical protein
MAVVVGSLHQVSYYDVSEERCHFLRLTDSFKFGWIFQHRPEPNSATLKMEVKRYFETSEQPKYTQRCQNPKDDRHLKNNGREKNTLKSYILGVVWIPE